MLCFLLILTLFDSGIAAFSGTRQNMSNASDSLRDSPRPVSKKLNLMILPLSAIIFFVGVIVSRCYCWMVQDIREHDRNLDTVFADHSLRHDHQANVEKVTTRRIHRLLQRGYSYSDELVNYMAAPFDPVLERNCASLGADFAHNDVKLVNWLDQVKTQLPSSPRSYHFSLSYPASFASSRSPPLTRSFPTLSRIPEDSVVDKVEPLLPNTDSTSLTIGSSQQSSSEAEEFSDPCGEEI